MKFESRNVGVFDVLVVRLEGHEVFDAGRLRQSVTEMVEAGSRRLVVDLSGVDYLYSDAINAFIAVNRRMIESSGRMGILATSGKVHEILLRAGIDNILRIYRSEQELVADSREIMRQSSSYNHPSDLPPSASQAVPANLVQGTTTVHGGNANPEDSGSFRVLRRRTGSRPEVRPRRPGGRALDVETDVQLPPELPARLKASDSSRILRQFNADPTTSRPSRPPIPAAHEVPEFVLPDGTIFDAGLSGADVESLDLTSSPQRIDLPSDVGPGRESAFLDPPPAIHLPTPVAPVPAPVSVAPPSAGEDPSSFRADFSWDEPSGAGHSDSHPAAPQAHTGPFDSRRLPTETRQAVPSPVHTPPVRSASARLSAMDEEQPTRILQVVGLAPAAPPTPQEAEDPFLVEPPVGVPQVVAPPEPVSRRQAPPPEPISPTKIVPPPEPISQPRVVAPPEPESRPQVIAPPEPVSRPQAPLPPEPISATKIVPPPEPTSQPRVVAPPEPVSRPQVVAPPEPVSRPQAPLPPEPIAATKIVPPPEPTSQPRVVAPPEPVSRPHVVASPEPVTRPQAPPPPEPVALAQAVLPPEPVSQPKIALPPEPVAPPQPTVPPREIKIDPVPVAQPARKPAPKPVLEPAKPSPKQAPRRTPPPPAHAPIGLEDDRRQGIPKRILMIGATLALLLVVGLGWFFVHARSQGSIPEPTTETVAPPPPPSAEPAKLESKPVKETKAEVKSTSEARKEAKKEADAKVAKEREEKASAKQAAAAAKPVPPPPPPEPDPADKKVDKVFVTSRPSGAKAVLDGKSVGKTPVELEIHGKAHLTLTLDGYQPLEKDLKLSDVHGTVSLELKAVTTPAPAPAAAAPSAGPIGKIFLSSSPAGAEIVFKGKVLGKTPRMVELPVGSCSLILRSGELSHNVDLDIKEGQNPAQHTPL